MIIDNIQFAAFCKNLKIDDKVIRRQIEDSLGDFSFSFFNFSPKFDIASTMMGQTEHGHSRLQISDKTVQLFITFDEVFRNDSERCFEYAYKKIEDVAQMINNIEGNFHSGVVIQYLFDENKYSDDAINLINRNSVNISGNQQFFNFSKSFSVIYKDKFYLNFKLSCINLKDDNKKIAGVSVDVNNRYASEIKNQFVGYDDIAIMKNIHQYITNSVLDKLLMKGELDLDES